MKFNKLNERKIFIIYIFFCLLLKNTLLQTLLFPIELLHLAYDIDDNKKNRKDKKETEEDKPIVETIEIKDEDGNNIRITRINYHKSKNLSGNSEGITPFQIMRIFDNRVNSIFEDIIRKSIGIKMLLNGLSMVGEDENEKNEKKFLKVEKLKKKEFLKN